MRRAAVIGTAYLAALLLLAVPAAATEFQVNTVNDPGTGVCDAAECTFREALTAANIGGVRDDRITFRVTGFISALSPFPAVASAATQGSRRSPARALMSSRSDAARGISGSSTKLSGADTLVEGLTITGGATSGGAGGGIRNAGTLVVDRVAVLDNNSKAAAR